jgi:hypothetical protein
MADDTGFLDVLALLHALLTERIATPVIACGLDRDSAAAVAAIKGGAREFLSLPPDRQIVAAILASIVGDEHALIIHDPVMTATVQRAEQVAAAEASVLITGESGTGAATCTTLTIGDGLVSQIPSLLVSTAAGIVVTKGATAGSADIALLRQIGGNPKPLAMAAGAAAMLALMPGLPSLPFLAIAGLAAGGAYFRVKPPVGGAVAE